MSDLAVLATKLAALGTSDEQFDGGARVISKGGFPNPLQGLLNVVDETVLERKLAFKVDGTILNVIAAGRRLRGIAAVEPAMAEAEPLIGQVLSREDPEMLDTARQVLTAVLGKAKLVTVRSHPAESFGTGGERGVSASGIAAEWLVEQDVAAPHGIGAILQADALVFSAFLHVRSGSIIATEGDATRLMSVWENQVDAFITAQDKSTIQREGPRLIALDNALDTGENIALMLDDVDSALVIFPDGEMPKLHAIWQASYA